MIAGVNVIAADTTAGRAGPVPGESAGRGPSSLFARRIGASPADLTDEQADELLAGGRGARRPDAHATPRSARPAEVRDYLDGFVAKTGADELIVVHQAPSLAARLRSVTLLAEAMDEAPAKSG